jgi:hypothetical protein
MNDNRYTGMDDNELKGEIEELLEAKQSVREICKALHISSKTYTRITGKVDAPIEASETDPYGEEPENDPQDETLENAPHDAKNTKKTKKTAMSDDEKVRITLE